MPGFDGSGPAGTGPMTGFGRGYCIGHAETGAGYVPRFGRGGGYGRRCCFYKAGLPRRAGWYRGASSAAAAYAPPVDKETELHLLKEQVVNLESALEQARKRIKALEQGE
ncbi:MAG: DUF5320 domain-containing protein [Peptococcaceae bacterium]|nr:DUF5320 domain-containing protein [Peptococcaceae bacterium]